MKQNIVIKGRIELSKAEVCEAAITYVNTEKKLTKAIDSYLSSKHGLTATRVRYAPATGEAVVDVDHKITDKVTRFSDDMRPLRDNKGGFARVNMGIFSFLKELLEAKRKAGNKKLTFDEVYDEVKGHYPKMEEDRLSMYLHDKRMLPNIKFSKRDNEVSVS